MRRARLILFAAVLTGGGYAVGWHVGKDHQFKSDRAKFARMRDELRDAREAFRGAYEKFVGCLREHE